jgi:hypothetical protein
MSDSMDKAFWQSILDADGDVPDAHSVASLTPELLPLVVEALRPMYACSLFKTRSQEGHFCFTGWEKGEREGTTPSQIPPPHCKVPRTLSSEDESTKYNEVDD